MPSGGPSAWRLNKAEQSQVKKDLDEWGTQHEQLRVDARDEFDRRRAEEKKRLERVFQEAKHFKSLQKQTAKAKASSGQAAKKPVPQDDAGSSCAVRPGLHDSGVNESYMQSLKNDLQVIADKLGDLKSELPVAIQQADDRKGGVQEHYFSLSLIFFIFSVSHCHC